MDLFSGTLKRPKLRPNRTVTEVDPDRTETETWTEWCAKNRTGPGPPNPTSADTEGPLACRNSWTADLRRTLSVVVLPLQRLHFLICPLSLSLSLSTLNRVSLLLDLEFIYIFILLWLEPVFLPSHVLLNITTLYPDFQLRLSRSLVAEMLPAAHLDECQLAGARQPSLSPSIPQQHDPGWRKVRYVVLSKSRATFGEEI